MAAEGIWCDLRVLPCDVSGEASVVSMLDEEAWFSQPFQPHHHHHLALLNINQKKQDLPIHCNYNNIR